MAFLKQLVAVLIVVILFWNEVILPILLWTDQLDSIINIGSQKKRSRKRKKSSFWRY